MSGAIVGTSSIIILLNVFKIAGGPYILNIVVPSGNTLCNFIEYVYFPDGVTSMLV